MRPNVFSLSAAVSACEACPRAQSGIAECRTVGEMGGASSLLCFGCIGNQLAVVTCSEFTVSHAEILMAPNFALPTGLGWNLVSLVSHGSASKKSGDRVSVLFRVGPFVGFWGRRRSVSGGNIVRYSCGAMLQLLGSWKFNASLQCSRTIVNSTRRQCPLYFCWFKLCGFSELEPPQVVHF